MGLGWMVWTEPTAIFFVVIALILAAMTAWQIAAPSPERKGFLPIPTTPGDRLFVGLLVAVTCSWRGSGSRTRACGSPSVFHSSGWR